MLCTSLYRPQLLSIGNCLNTALLNDNYNIFRYDGQSFAVWVNLIPVSWGRFKNIFELLNLRALKFSLVNKIHIFQCMGNIFWVEFQRYPLNFHIKYLAHTFEELLDLRAHTGFWNAPRGIRRLCTTVIPQPFKCVLLVALWYRSLTPVIVLLLVYFSTAVFWPIM